MSSVRRVVIGNWKMNTTLAEANEIATRLAGEQFPDDVAVGVAPPFPWLSAVKASLGTTGIWLGAQTCAERDWGAYTGEVSAPMLAELCAFVLVGHAERRVLFGETDDVVRVKLEQVLAAGLRPVLCVGESFNQRHAGAAEAVVTDQICSALAGFAAEELRELIVAYEPVWAIGTGLTASPEDAEAMHEHIRANLNALAIDGVPVLYGGSVKPASADSLIALGNVDGFLVGGASLIPLDFCAIVNSARN